VIVSFAEEQDEKDKVETAAIVTANKDNFLFILQISFLKF
jgi:hypothetical protein